MAERWTGHGSELTSHMSAPSAVSIYLYDYRSLIVPVMADNHCVVVSAPSSAVIFKQDVGGDNHWENDNQVMIVT
jgi:hypothetical protein